MNRAKELAWDLHVLRVDQMLDIQRAQFVAGEKVKNMMVIGPTQAEVNTIELAMTEERIRVSNQVRRETEQDINEREIKREEAKNEASPKQDPDVVDK